MNIWESIALSVVLAALKTAVKNPQSVAKEEAILQEIYNDLGIILAGLNPPSTT